MINRTSDIAHEYILGSAWGPTYRPWRAVYFTQGTGPRRMRGSIAFEELPELLP